MINVNNLIKIYKSYGFEVEEHSTSEIAVFSYKQGRYFGVDIVPLISNEQILKEINRLKTEYSDSGFATTIRYIKDEEEAEIELFRSFFSFDSTIARLNRKYQEFVKKQTNNLLGSRYKYITSPFEIYNTEREGRLIELVTDVIIKEDKAHLIIIEAAAGYGKTSTAYEILDSLIQSDSILSPILTELARNRGANIFRYILLDVIDKEFPTLNSELVIKEIQKGRVPLIIDGFDELLDKVNLEADISSIEEIEPMLNTIGELLIDKAKIVLTTRKTAIFNDYEFEQWINKWGNKFEIIRIAIKEPSIKDWLGQERFQILENHNMALHHLANPVMLAYLKSLNFEDYNSVISNGQNLVDQYFQRMLEREKDRQNLLATPETQLIIFKNVVRLLLELDSTSEKKEFFKEIIKDQNIKLLESTRLLYPEKPTIDNLVDILANHALLDRKGSDGNKIGFINDFVLGVFIGEIINDIDSSLTHTSYSAYMIELAVTAYKVQSEEKRLLLWQRINQVYTRFSDYSLFIFDVVLLNQTKSNYTGLTIKEISFIATDFSHNVIKESVFINCTFKNCYFDLTKLQGISFISCQFHRCKCIPQEDQFNNHPEIVVIQCSQYDCLILKDEDNYLQESQTLIDELERDILDLLWEFQMHRKHYISAIIRKVHNASYRRVSIALQSLESRGLIKIKGSEVQFQMNKIDDIRKLVQ
ncbi:hypothetical protein [Emticicia sp. 17c]|uniref:hypothetical protein n=1 Tax=Emticicia sp. 17c TaxID=3127704 RepID=UPI00301D83CE